MNVTITAAAFRSIIAQAQADAPIESCGYALGERDAEGNLHITHNYPLTNTDHAEDHFSLDPREQFAAIRYARAEGLVVVGNWHSHPVTRSRPSLEDIRLAYDPDILYLIVSLSGASPVLNAFRIVDGWVTVFHVGVRD